MPVGFPFAVRAQLALRVKLAAFLVLALLFTGTFNLRPSPVEGARAPISQEGTQAPGHRDSLASSHAGVELDKARRQRHVVRRSPRYEEIHESAQAIGWPDLEKGAPNLPRLLFRKLPSDEGSGADADGPHAPAQGPQPRAPPAMA